MPKNSFNVTVSHWSTHWWSKVDVIGYKVVCDVRNTSDFKPHFWDCLWFTVVFWRKYLWICSRFVLKNKKRILKELKTPHRHINKIINLISPREIITESMTQLYIKKLFARVGWHGQNKFVIKVPFCKISSGFSLIFLNDYW